MTTTQFVAGSVAIVLLLAIGFWEWDKYRERKRSKRGKVLEMRPYFSSDEKERMYWL